MCLSLFGVSLLSEVHPDVSGRVCLGPRVCLPLGRVLPENGVPMYYDGELSREQVDAVPCETELSKEEVFEVMEGVMRR